jgi:hypothetical protein
MTTTANRDLEILRTDGCFLKRILRRGYRDEGGSLVEMALVCAFVYLPMLFGIFQVSYGIYVYNVVCSTAHQLTRYAAVRGLNSCDFGNSFADCDLSPTGSSNPTSTDPNLTLKTYMPKFALNPNYLTVSTTWYTESFDNSSGYSIANWSACTTANNATTPCNLPGYQVQVQVTYNFPLNIPFWGHKTIPITSVSRMMIDE